LCRTKQTKKKVVEIGTAHKILGKEANDVKK